jgi:4-aminobutyrate aminotransferase-like enzyme
VRVAPPLLVDDHEIDAALGILSRVMADLTTEAKD